jgi:hypothetical protein
MNAITFLAIRSAHVLVAALWIGSTVFGAALLMPALDAAGAPGGVVMMRLVKKGYAAYMTAISLTTLVTGVYLLWRFTGGFDLSVAATHAGMAFGAGGAAGILAGIIGGVVVGRSARELSGLARLAALPVEDPARGLVAQRSAQLRQRMRAGTRVVIGLQSVAVILMAVGHYV